jgi:2,4-dienoyl-CoA reductase-like NADH-dependent reductase (Old Yellow Enzyme family)
MHIKRIMELYMKGKLRAFEGGIIGKLSIKNRLVRSATFECMADDNGEVNDDLVNLYKSLCLGGIGLIITGHCPVSPIGFSHPKQIRIYDDRYIKCVNKIALAVHNCNNDCKIFMQLTHAGRQQARPELGFPAVAPSAIFDPLFQRTPRELTQNEISEIIQLFAKAIKRCKEAEFDGVQLHAAHGWLLSSFLSPHTNQRSDKYGGSTFNRVRIMREIYENAVKYVGGDYPILAKINSQDFVEDGINLEEAINISNELKDIGFAAIEVSGGMWESLLRTEQELGWKPVPIPEARIGINNRESEAYFWPNARQIAKAVDIPIILVGGIRSLSTIESILEEGNIEFCAMARPLIREPDLPIKWLNSEHADSALCISCNRCLPRENAPLECRAEQKSLSPSDLLAKLFPYFRERGGK